LNQFGEDEHSGRGVSQLHSDEPDDVGVSQAAQNLRLLHLRCHRLIRRGIVDFERQPQGLARQLEFRVCANSVNLAEGAATQ
jgi:hypothetical protein